MQTLFTRAYRWLLPTLLIGGTTLTAAAQSFPTNVEIPEPAATLTLGEAVTGDLDEAAPVFAYTLNLEAGEVVSISATFEDVDGYLAVLDGDGDEVAYNDDGPGGLYDSAISPFIAAEAGSYTVLVTSLRYVSSDGDDVSIDGDFELTVSPITLQAVAVDDVIEGELETETETDVYTLDAVAGQVLDIRVDAAEESDLDPVLTVTAFDPENTTRLRDDDSGDELNARLGAVFISEDGTYILTVTSFVESSSGAYVLTVGETEAEAISIDGASTVEGELTEAETSALFTFEGSDGSTLDLAAEASGDLDLYLEVYGPENTLIASNDDTDGLNPALSDLELTDGTYTIVLRPLFGFFGDDGGFSLLINGGGESAGGDEDAATPEADATPEAEATAGA